MLHWREKKKVRLQLKPSCRRKRKVITHLKQKRSDCEGFETAVPCRLYSKNKAETSFSQLLFGLLKQYLYNIFHTVSNHCRV